MRERGIDAGAGDVVRAIRGYIGRLTNRPGTVGHGMGVAVSLLVFGWLGTSGVFVDGLHVSRLLEWWDGVARLPVRTQLAYLAGFCWACSGVFGALAYGLLRAADHTGGGEVTR